MRITKNMFILGICMLFIGGCKGSDPGPVTPPVVKPVPSKPAITGSRIAWDYSTQKRISIGSGYNGYPRLIQLSDKSLLCIYESVSRTVCVKSTDLGTTWSAPIVISTAIDNVNMAVPEVIELQDKSLLACYNPRPKINDPALHYGIRTKKSYDGGLTWKDERLVYEAGTQSQDGCWEPAAIQLPSGEIQLFYSDEYPYASNNDQNISMFSSTDGGLTWSSSPKIISYRAGRRDGMPVPILINNNTELVFSIEDNGNTNFKPYTIRGLLADKWSKAPVTATSADRHSALQTPLSIEIYAGAPYLAKLANGETILSYQSTEGRTIHNDAHAYQMVAIGDANAKNFNRKSVPFAIPTNRVGVWNSVAVVEGNTVIALTSTNAFGADIETWMIKGYVIPDVTATTAEITVDGNLTETPWKTSFPVFMGHKGTTQARIATSYNNTYLFIATDVTDNNVYNDSPAITDNDGITFYLDAKNKSLEAPDKGIFSIFLSADNKLSIKEGDNKSWKEISNAGISTVTKTTAKGYVQEIAIPWAMLGGKPAVNTRIGFNTALTDDSNGGFAEYTESIPSNETEAPYTWSTLLLK